MLCNSIGMSCESIDFGIGEVVLFQVCDLFKNLQTLLYGIISSIPDDSAFHVCTIIK